MAHLADGAPEQEGMSANILSILICILHWKLRVCECLVSRIVNAISSSPAKIEVINAIWKQHGIHARISKSEGSSTWGVHGMDGDSVDLISGYYASWLPDTVQLLLPCLNFTRLVADPDVCHRSAPS
jgi:hypothetical protein